MLATDTTASAKKKISAADTLDRLAQLAANRFRTITRGYALFNITYFLLFATELFALLLFFPFFTKSSVVAFTLASLFLTGFSYFVLRFYLQGRKPQQLLQLKDEFETRCRSFLPRDLPLPTIRHTLVQGFHLFIAQLQGQEYQFYPLPSWLSSLQPLMEKFSLWCHWQDVLDAKEILYKTSLQLQVENMKLEPTSLEIHATLAKTYIALYQVFQAPQIFASKEQTETLRGKFQSASHRALEELKILNVFAPEDLWVQAQLALVYGDLGKKDKEIECCETMARLSPQDRDILFRLGLLYFTQGRMAQGLKIYDQLKKGRDPRADELLQNYLH